MVSIAQTAIRAYRILAHERVPLPALAAFTTIVEPAPPSARRSLGAIDIGGVVHTATFCHPPTSLRLELAHRSPARISVDVAFVPTVCARNTGGVTFTLRAQRPASGRERQHSVVLRPGSRFRDRRWRRLSVSVPPAASSSDGAVTLTLSTSVPAEASQDWAWAICSDPVMTVRRSPAGSLAVLRSWVRKVRDVGLARTWLQATGSKRPPASSSAYQEWLTRHAPGDAELAAMREALGAWPDRPLISVITPVFNTPPAWLEACGASLQRQVYDRWEWCVADDASTQAETVKALDGFSGDDRVKVCRLSRNGGISRASNVALGNASGQIVVLLDHDDELAPHALWEVANAFRNAPEVSALYSDEDKIEEDGRHSDPYFKPDWSPELFLGTMYVCHLTAMRKDLISGVGGFREGYEGSQDYDLWLRATETSPRVGHIPKILYHWRRIPGSAADRVDAKPWALDAARRALEDALTRRGIPAAVEPGLAPGNYRVRFSIAGDPYVSILVPTSGAERDAAEVSACLASLASSTRGRRVELIIASTSGTIPDVASQLLASVPSRIVEVTGPFNFSASINAAARAAQGDYLLLVNDDVEAVDEGWLDAMLEYAQQEDIGAVGPRLDFPDGRIQHVGLILGVRGVAAHAFHSAAGDCPGYFGSVIGPRNVSAVSGACLMTRTEVFRRVGGFDEAFAMDFNDVDYCLRLQAQRLRVVYTPFARLRHHQGATSGPRHPARESIRLMRQRWNDRLEGDPYYNPNLSRDFVDFRLG